MTRKTLALALLGAVLLPTNGLTCTDIVVGKDASVDGSVITSHTGAAPDCRVHVVPAQTHAPGSMAPVYFGMLDAKVPYWGCPT
ncbi:C69 family dipeptidase [uncultured Thioclava sp.]|uniref:C69 family dipeptidase n=1 Tax=uncultured Thioclava sp. TaxID=473858 RepID=UPI0025CE0427|nr:C69 family dipeptidase [uncultured Thioclava sp.]